MPEVPTIQPTVVISFTAQLVNKSISEADMLKLLNSALGLTLTSSTKVVILHLDSKSGVMQFYMTGANAEKSATFIKALSADDLAQLLNLKALGVLAAVLQQNAFDADQIDLSSTTVNTMVITVAIANVCAVALAFLLGNMLGISGQSEGAAAASDAPITVTTSSRNDGILKLPEQQRNEGRAKPKDDDLISLDDPDL